MKRLVVIAVIMALVVFLVKTVPLWLASLSGNPSLEVNSDHEVELQIDAFLEDTLPNIGASQLLARDVKRGVVRSTWQLDYGTSLSGLATELQRRAAAEGIDVHPQESTTPDRIIEVFGHRDLVHELLLISPAPRVSTPGFNPDPNQRPMVALILTDLGMRPAEYIVEMPIPLTLAIRPYLPYSLWLAEQSVHHWHEVLLDATELSPASGSLSNAYNALPFATGIRVEDAPDGELPEIPLGVLLHPSTLEVSDESRNLTPLMAQDARRLGLETARDRALHSATTTGLGVLSIPYDHPQIEQLLSWAIGADDEGYRLVLVSEAIREAQFRGPEAFADSSDE